MTRKDEDLVDRLVTMGLPWLREQRDLHRKGARRLTQEEKQLLAGYYDGPTLDTVRLAMIKRHKADRITATHKPRSNPHLLHFCTTNMLNIFATGEHIVGVQRNETDARFVIGLRRLTHAYSHSQYCWQIITLV